jgi:hypothetical protein
MNLFISLLRAFDFFVFMIIKMNQVLIFSLLFTSAYFLFHQVIFLVYQFIFYMIHSIDLYFNFFFQLLNFIILMFNFLFKVVQNSLLIIEYINDLIHVQVNFIQNFNDSNFMKILMFVEIVFNTLKIDLKYSFYFNLILISLILIHENKYLSQRVIILYFHFVDFFTIKN